MILYQLACDSGHRFESWFRNSDACDEQMARALVSCPLCQSTHVAKSVMAPALLGRQHESRHVNAHGAEHHEDGPREAAAPADSKAPMDVALLDPKAQELRALVKALREKVIASSEDVGTRFPDEARRIHDGELPARQIYGQATIAEALDLLDDGITVLPLPGLPEDFN